MTDSPVELTRRALAAFNARDMETLLSFMSEDVGIDSRITWLEGEVCGHHGMRRWWALLDDAFLERGNEILDIEEHGDGVLAKLRSWVRARRSDTPVEETLWQGARWREGKCTWWGHYSSRDEAIAALQARQAADS